jgi:S1-C subfamily serine protease
MIRTGAAALFLLLLSLPVARACDTARPITLAFHPSTADTALQFERYRETVDRVAGSYVRVVICQPASGPRVEASENPNRIINGASGVIVDRSGLVVTAAHIAADTKNDALVITLDGRSHKARILRVERNRELALLQIAPIPGMRVAEFGDSDRLVAGDSAFAVGTPDNKAGIVSLGRVLVPKLAERLDYNGYGFADAIKLRIDVVPGNSGGPIFDRQGLLMGIVGAFGLPDPGQQESHLGYAVPSNAIRNFLAKSN